MSRIYLSPPDVREAEVEYLLAAVRSGWVAPVGPDIDVFEAELAVWGGRPHVVALSSGTAALHLALLAVGVQPGDVVIVQSFTFNATANAVTYVGAEPAFVDSEPRTWNMCADLLTEMITDLRQKGRRIGAVIAVDLYGRAAEWDRLSAVCKEAEIPLIEDAAEALGATDADGRPCGSFGDIAVFSFNGNKIITTSGGGALLCDDVATAERARYLATQARQPAAHYEHTEVGYNYRLSNLLAAFGRGQLSTLPERITRRKEIRRRYADELAGEDVEVAIPSAESDNAWLTCLLMPRDARDAVRLRLEAVDVEARPLWMPLHEQPVWAGSRRVVDGTADGLFARGLCVPSGSGMTDDDHQCVLSALATIRGASASGDGELRSDPMSRHA